MSIWAGGGLRGHSSSAPFATTFSLLTASAGHGDGSSVWSGCSDPKGANMVTQAWAGDQRCLGVSRKPPEGIAGHLLDGLDGGVITSSQTRPCSIQAPHKQMNNHLKLLFCLGISANLHVCACACTHVHICVNMNMHLQVSMNVPHVNVHVINSSSS